MAIERKPALQVFGVPAVFLESIRAVLPLEDVDAAITGRIVERCKDSTGRANGNFLR